MFDQAPEQTEAVQTPDFVPHPPRALSTVMRQLAARQQGEVSVRCIRNALADRSLAAFLVLTCVMNMLPFPPGSTIVLGVPVVLVALQMVAGRPTVWLPEFFLNRSMSHERFSKMTRRIIPLLEKLERWIRPRQWPFISHRAGERVVGLYALILGVAVILPVPFGNWLPAFSCAICGLALSERDGLWLWIGAILGLISITIIFGVLFTAGSFAMHYWTAT